jgi:flagella basal body P-ring formation protein FlgA
MIRNILLTILVIILAGYMPSADAKISGEKFYLDALNEVLETELKNAGVRPPLRVEGVFLVSSKTERVVTSDEAKRLYGWKEFSLTDLKLNDRTNRFSAKILVANKGDEDSLSRKLHMEMLTVKGKMVRLVDVPVLRKTAHNGEIITEDDIDWITFPEKKISPSVITSKKVLLGKTPKRRILANSVIRIRDINSPTLIKKGDTVSIVYKAKYINLRTLGYALQDGKKGEFIRIQNPKSKMVVQAKVVDKGTAHVLSSESMSAIVASAGF